MNDHGPSTTTLPLPPSAHTSFEDEVAVACYENEIPPFLDAELQRLYGNIHSTLSHLRIYGGYSQVSHVYVARRNGHAIAAFLFRRDGNRVRVLNEGMAFGDDALRRFAQFVFDTWPSSAMIIFHAVESTLANLPFPYQQHECTANIVLPLPATVDDYVASLGKNMRRNLRRYDDRFHQDFPGLRYDVSEGEAISEAQVREIIALNRLRIAGKHLRYGLEEEVEQVIALARECGMVGVMTVDGKVIAGAVGYLAGANYFFKVIAHDPAYNAYSPGILCCFQTISACIMRGCKEYNFMWNEYEYKFALGAHSRSLYHVVVYRSRLRYLLSAPTACRTAFSGWRYRMSSLLDKTEKPENLSAADRLALHAMARLRQLKRMLKRN